MIAEDFLKWLELAHRSGRGWMARCPAHDDKNPSLSIHEGEKGLLLRCWAGCTAEEVMAALGIGMADLFYDADLSPHERRRRRNQPKPRRFDWRRYAGEFEDEAISLWLRGTTVLQAAHDLDCSRWTDADFERAFECVSSAETDLARAACFEDLAFLVRSAGLRRENEDARLRKRSGAATRSGNRAAASA